MIRRGREVVERLAMLRLGDGEDALVRKELRVVRPQGEPEGGHGRAGRRGGVDGLHPAACREQGVGDAPVLGVAGDTAKIELKAEGGAEGGGLDLHVPRLEEQREKSTVDARRVL